jgi:hypothetical protein
MLAQLSTVKTRLGIDEFDVKDDALLTHAIEAVSARFDRECNRTLARAVNAAQEFNGADLELCPACYPIESVTRFELKTTEVEGWVEQADIDFLIRSLCVISLAAPLGDARAQARVIYTGGYVLPGATAGAGQAALPADLETAAVEQVAFWYQNRDRVGVLKEWPKGGIYQEFADIDLIPSVRAVLGRYERWRW